LDTLKPSLKRNLGRFRNRGKIGFFPGLGKNSELTDHQELSCWFLLLSKKELHKFVQGLTCGPLAHSFVEDKTKSSRFGFARILISTVYGFQSHLLSPKAPYTREPSTIRIWRILVATETRSYVRKEGEKVVEVRAHLSVRLLTIPVPLASPLSNLLIEESAVTRFHHPELKSGFLDNRSLRVRL